MPADQPSTSPVRSRRGRVRRETLWAVGLGVGALGVSIAMATIPTTINDFFIGGTQPMTLNESIADANDCDGCHSFIDQQSEPWRPWAASMMGQAARDPIFYAALAIANQDAAFAGESCIRCHAPGGWLHGHSSDPTGGALTGVDLQGVSCNFCHRMVDPVYKPGISPAADQAILAAVGPLPPSPHTGSFVVDPDDVRRGPRTYSPTGFNPPHAWAKSPFHSTSNMCATCHDVNNQAYMKQPSGAYTLTPVDQPHPTGDPADMFPLERTYGEWKQSAFAVGPVDVGGRFGGNLAAVSSCQDCHMPKTTGQSCSFGPTRSNLSQHHFNGGNTWVLKAIRDLEDDFETGLSEATVNDSIARARTMLANASDLDLAVTTAGSTQSLRTRVINWSGHKLPTGYPEGRRIWVNVKFKNSAGALVAERGAYDMATAVLTTADTKVYEAKIGVDAAVSAATGIPVGPGFHFAVNNAWYLDNRIPPKGSTNAGLASVQASPVAYSYADGQHWDDTLYTVPAGAASAEVRVFYQLTSKEYIEFLRDANTTNGAGLLAYDRWVAHGKSAPELLDFATIAIPAFCYADCDGSGALSPADFTYFLSRYRAGSVVADCDNSGGLSPADFTCFLAKYRMGCP